MIWRGWTGWHAALVGLVMVAPSCASVQGPEPGNGPGAADFGQGEDAFAAGEVMLVPRPPVAFTSIPKVEFSDFYAFGPRGPALTPEILALDGKRVTLTGFMVQMESPPRGGFYLAPYPAFCDESGAGRGGLPPPSVLVLPQGARGKEIGFVDGALETSGILDLGNKSAEDGEAATVRLSLEGPDDFRLARATGR
jgi:hypothetical protein